MGLTDVPPKMGHMPRMQCQLAHYTSSECCCSSSTSTFDVHPLADDRMTTAIHIANKEMPPCATCPSPPVFCGLRSPSALESRSRSASQLARMPPQCTPPQG